MNINNDLKLVYVNQPIEIVEKVFKSRKRIIVLKDAAMWTFGFPIMLIGSAIEFFGAGRACEAHDKKELKECMKKLKFMKCSSDDIRKMSEEERLAKIAEQVHFVCGMVYCLTGNFFSWKYQDNYISNDIYSDLYKHLKKHNLDKIPIKCNSEDLNCQQEILEPAG